MSFFSSNFGLQYILHDVLLELDLVLVWFDSILKFLKWKISNYHSSMVMSYESTYIQVSAR